jgi:hypothetical protein
MDNRVDFPAPFYPMIKSVWQASISKEMLSGATKSLWNCLRKMFFFSRSIRVRQSLNLFEILSTFITDAFLMVNRIWINTIKVIDNSFYPTPVTRFLKSIVSILDSLALSYIFRSSVISRETFISAQAIKITSNPLAFVAIPIPIDRS